MTAEHFIGQRHAIGQRLREWRLRRERSQVEIAREAGITQASLSNYETGKRDLPLPTFLAVAATLEVSIGDLLDVPEIVVVRDTIIGRAVARLVERPELADQLAPPPAPPALAEAAS